jgi:hypothetical protein
VWKLKTWYTCWLSETPREPSKGVRTFYLWICICRSQQNFSNFHRFSHFHSSDSSSCFICLENTYSEEVLTS